MDDDVQEAFAELYGAAQKRLAEDPEFAKREPYKGPERPRRPDRKNHTSAKDLDVATALEWVIVAQAYAHRVQDPPVTLSGLQNLWDMYRRRYAPAHEKSFPFEEALALNLTVLQWHDVFNRVQQYAGKKEQYGDDHSSNVTEPFSLILNLARKVTKNGDAHAWRRDQALRYLRSQNIDVSGYTDVDALQQYKDEILEAQRYPRTYL